MPVQMQRVNVVAGIVEFEAIAPPFMDGPSRLHGLHRESLAVEEPLIEAIERAVVFDHRYVKALVGRSRRRASFAEDRVVPLIGFRLTPLRLAPINLEKVL